MAFPLVTIVLARRTADTSENQTQSSNTSDTTEEGKVFATFIDLPNAGDCCNRQTELRFLKESKPARRAIKARSICVNRAVHHASPIWGIKTGHLPFGAGNQWPLHAAAEA